MDACAGERAAAAARREDGRGAAVLRRHLKRTKQRKDQNYSTAGVQDFAARRTRARNDLCVLRFGDAHYGAAGLVHSGTRQRLRSERQGSAGDGAFWRFEWRAGHGSADQDPEDSGRRSGKHRRLRNRARGPAVYSARRVEFPARGSGTRSAIHAAAAGGVGIQSSVLELSGSESDFGGKQSMAVGCKQRGSHSAGSRHAALGCSRGPHDRFVFSARRRTDERLCKLERHGALGSRASSRAAG